MKNHYWGGHADYCLYVRRERGKVERKREGRRECVCRTSVGVLHLHSKDIFPKGGCFGLSL